MWIAGSSKFIGVLILQITPKKFQHFVIPSAVGMKKALLCPWVLYLDAAVQGAIF
jgi:hypothetical protein